jgi:hypothetical protein
MTDNSLTVVTHTPVAAETVERADRFDVRARTSLALSNSDLVPEAFRGNPSNCLIAIDIAERLGMSPLMVMQNIHIIHGKPSWASQFIIAAINSSKRFTTLRYEYNNEHTSCRAYATERETGEVIYGAPVTMEMANAEGWVQKKNSKWVTMRDLMLMYRAAAFFGRVYCPELLNGMYSDEEQFDIGR